jgi:hypothetical protein
LLGLAVARRLARIVSIFVFPILPLCAGFISGASGQDRSAGARKLPASSGAVLFAPDSVWNKPLASNAPLDPASHAMARGLAAQAARELALGIGPWIETNFDSTPIYRVPADQPTVRVQLDNGISNAWRSSLQPAFDAVPIPRDARPAAGSDGHMTVWQPSTNKLWELYEARKESDGWHFKWGGAMEDVSRSPGYYTTSSWPGALPVWGSTATSLPIAAGVITLREIQQGHIDHALALNLPYPREGVWAWPAQRSDGTGTAPDAIPEGAHLRLDPRLDLSALHLPRLAVMMARAAQKYGMIVRDQTHHAIGFFTEDPTPTDPTLFYVDHVPRAQGPFQGLWPVQLLRNFPWRAVEVLKMSLHRRGDSSSG